MADRDPKDFAPVPGVATCPGESVADILARDIPRVPPEISTDSFRDLGADAIAAHRYTSHEFFLLEKERMWPRVWQMAARDEEFPDAGDLVVYDNLGKSVILVRQPHGGVRAFWNVCLHRGRKLRTES
ncbi:MAG: Rieske 2Fe-2S domain-containing protein, partial [Thermaurantiacus sp.]